MYNGHVTNIIKDCQQLKTNIRYKAREPYIETIGIYIIKNGVHVKEVIIIIILICLSSYCCTARHDTYTFIHVCLLQTSDSLSMTLGRIEFTDRTDL